MFRRNLTLLFSVVVLHLPKCRCNEPCRISRCERGPVSGDGMQRQAQAVPIPANRQAAVPAFPDTALRESENTKARFRPRAKIRADTLPISTGKRLHFLLLLLPTGSQYFVFEKRELPPLRVPRSALLPRCDAHAAAIHPDWSMHQNDSDLYRARKRNPLRLLPHFPGQIEWTPSRSKVQLFPRKVALCGTAPTLVHSCFVRKTARRDDALRLPCSCCRVLRALDPNKPPQPNTQPSNDCVARLRRKFRLSA